LTPLLALPANAQVTVIVDGLTDLYGNVLSVNSWSFTTGAQADFTNPTVVMQSIGGNGNAQISPNESLVFVFDRPTDPQSVASFAASFDLGGTLNFATTNAVFSSDLRTLTISASPAWASGQQANLNISSGLNDLSGNVISNIQYLQFRVAFNADTTPPQLLAVSPADGQTGLPLNAQIIADFSEQVVWPTLGGITLMNGSDPVLMRGFRRSRHSYRIPPTRW
jgi:hypothetical protein